MTDDDDPLSAFAPCTLEGLADEWWRLNKEIADLRRSRDHIERILLEASAAEHNGKDEPWRTGRLIEGRTCSVQAIWRLTEGGDRPKWEPHLEIVR